MDPFYRDPNAAPAPAPVGDYHSVPQQTMYQSRDWTFNGGGVSPANVALQPPVSAGSLPTYPDIGKLDMGIPELGRPFDPNADLPQQEAPQPGLFGTITGIPGAIAGQLIGSSAEGLPQPLQDIGYTVGHIPQYIGDLVDHGLDAAGNTLFGKAGNGLMGRTVAQEYAALPMTAEKAAFEARLNSAGDSIARDQAMLGYIQGHEVEWAHARGVDPQFAQTLLPETSLSGFLRNLTFGLMSGLEGSVAYAAANNGLRLGQQGLSDQIRTMDPASLDDGKDSNGNQVGTSLRAIAERYRSGEITLDEASTIAANSAYAWSGNPDWGPLGRIADFAYRIGTDPLIIAGGITGLAARTIETGALAETAIRAASLLEKGNPDAYGSLLRVTAEERVAAAGRAGQSLSYEKAAGNLVDRVNGNEFGRAIQEAHPDVWNEALSQASPTARALVSMQPALQTIAHTTETLMNPMKWFGVGRVGEIMTSRAVDGSIKGVVQTFGAPNVMAVQAIFDRLQMPDKYHSSFSNMAATVTESMHQKSMQKEVARTGELIVPEGARGADGKLITPNDVAANRRGAMPTSASEVESHLRPLVEDFTPHEFGGGSAKEGTAARAAAVERARVDAAQQLVGMTGVPLSEAQTIAKGMNEAQMQFLHALYWGDHIETFMGGRETALQAATSAHASAAQRYEEVLAGAREKPVEAAPASAAAPAPARARRDARGRFIRTEAGPEAVVDPEALPVPVEPDGTRPLASRVETPEGEAAPTEEAPTAEAAPTEEAPAVEPVASEEPAPTAPLPPEASPEVVAAKAEMDKAAEAMGLAQRYTPIGNTVLTMGRAKALQAALKGANAVAEARRALRYDDLNRALDSSVSDERLVRDMQDFLKHALKPSAEGGSRLVQEVEDLATLPKAIRDIAEAESANRGDLGYKVGLSPEDPWSIRRGTAGEVKGVHAWLDPVRVPNYSRPITRMDRVRSGLATPIYGNRILAEAQREVRRIGMEKYGLTRDQSEGIFWALRKAQIDSPGTIGPRGMSAGAMQRIINRAYPEGSPLFRRLGKDGLTELVARAYQGDIRTVGLAPRITGGMKTAATLGGRTNALGVVAEQLYPMAKFVTNPLLQIQVFFESPFLNVLRGINPGFRPNAQTLELLKLIDRFRNSADHFVDTLEFDGHFLMGTAAAKAMAGEGTRLSMLSSRIRLPADIRDIKVRAHANIFGHEAGLEMKSKMQQQMPGIWGQMEQHYGTADPTEVMLRWMSDNSADHESLRQRLFGYDASVPDSLGRARDINLRDMATHFGTDSVENLRKKVAGGDISEAQFKAAYETQKRDPEFIARAWQHVSSKTPEEYRVAIRRGFRDAGMSKADAKVAADGWLDMYARHAKIEGKTLHGWMSENLNGIPVGFTSTGELPTTAFLQSAKDFNEGIVRPDGSRVIHAAPGTPQFVKTQALAQSLIGKADAGPADAGNIAESRNDYRAFTEGKGRPVQLGRKETSGPDEGKVSTKTITWAGDAGRDSGIRYGPEQTGKDYVDWADATLTPAEAEEAAGWYDGVITQSHTIAQLLTDDERQWIFDRGNEARVKNGEAPIDQADALEFIAAKLAVAFGGTQSQASPIAGMLAMMGLMERHLHGVRVGLEQKGLGTVYGSSVDRVNAVLSGGRTEGNVKALREAGKPQAASIYGGLGPFGVGPKLSDFVDDIVGNVKARSFTSAELAKLSGLEPAAMDVWMNRVFGRIDHEYVRMTAAIMSRRELGPKTAENTKAWADSNARNMNIVLDDLGIGGNSNNAEKRLVASGIPEKSNPDSPGQYTWALSKMNEVKNALNNPDLHGGKPYMNRQWNIAEAQALLWVAQQKAFGLASDGIGSLGHRTSASIAVGRPLGGVGSLRADRLPTPSEITAAAGVPESLAFRAHVANVAAADLALRVQKITGAAPIRSNGAIFAVVGEHAPGAEPGAFVQYIGGDHQLLDAGDAMGMLSENERVISTRPNSNIISPGMRAVTQKTEADSNWTNQWAHDWVVPPPPKGISKAVWEHALGEWMQWTFGHNAPEGHVLVGAVDGQSRQVMRLVYLPENWKTGGYFVDHMRDGGKKGPALWPEADHLAAVKDGTWFQKWAAKRPEYAVKNAPLVPGLDIAQEPQLVGFHLHEGGDFQAQRDAVQARGLTGDELDAAVKESYGRGYQDALGSRGKPSPVSLHRDRLDHGQVVEGAFHAGSAPAAIAKSYADKQSRNTITDIHYQPSAATGGDARGAVAWGDTNRAQIFIGKKADASTAVHEAFHTFAKSLDESGKQVIADEYAKATGEPAVWSHAAEEWGASQFERFAFTGEASSANVQGVWNHFGAWAKAAGLTSEEVSPALRKVFDSLFAQPDSEVHAHYNMDEQRMVEVVRQALQGAEDLAQRVHHFKPGRTWVERSLNHPYFGAYPFSWMVGKILPEFTRFLMKAPFGLKAPLMGAALARDLMTTMQMTMNTDPEARDYFDKRPHMVRMMNMVLPGTPWEMPVNLPLYMRQYAQIEAENKDREAAGLKPKHLGLGATLNGLIQHALGMGTFMGDVEQAIGDWTGNNNSLQPKGDTTTASVAPQPNPFAAQQAAMEPQLEALRARGMPGNTQQAQPAAEADVASPAQIAGGAPVSTGPSNVPGMVRPGNIDLNHRPIVHNADGTISTVKSFSIGIDGHEVLIPQVVNGQMVSQAEAIDHYRQTGEELGVFDSVAAANAYAELLHQQQAAQYAQ